MPGFKIVLLVFFYFFDSLASGSKCPEDAISKLVVCYFEGESPLTNLNICNCTHLIFTNAVRKTENNSINATEGTIRYLDIIKENKKNLTTIFTLETKTDEASLVLKSENKSEQLINSIVDFLQKTQFDGVELDFKFSSDDGVTKESYASFVKNLSKTLKSYHRRVKRDGYDVFEKLQDDITTVAYTTQTPKNSTSKTQSIKQRTRKRKESNRKIREKKDEDEADYLTLEEAINTEFAEEKQNTLKDLEENAVEEKKLVFFVRLSVQPEIIAKKYDLKAISRYADILTVPTHDIVNKDEEHLTYHPSRLMGLSDILNTDSVLDFLTGMGGLKSKMVISLPAAVLKFQLKDEKKNTPRSPTVSKPQVIDQSQLCGLFSKNNWTLERDDDLTAPYAFSGKTWLAFEDEISVNIKGKYILLRELAGGAIYPIDFDLNDGSCNNRTGSGGYLTGILHKNFENLERKPRALVLESLQDEIHDLSFVNAKGGIQVSEYRIVRVVDHSGAVHVIRKNTKTQFECSRQGYFSHPLGCNKFYRCVKFDQYSDEFTVFEYDCPAGLAFDERWEVCVWPGSLPHGAPCTGSSEIAPVPRSHYQCPNHEGYFADPENCRWFFACLDHARDGITPLTAYEFRCPFGLVFSAEKLACDWPWLVGSCGNRGAAGYLNVNAATFINGGNLEASFGQYDNLDQTASFIGFGQKFGSGLRESGQNSYQGAQSAGYGYIASQFDDNRDKASFAAFPDYEISGGRIFNKGGVVLNQNIAGVVGGSGSINIRGGSSGESRNLAGGYFQQGIDITPEIKYQRLEPASTTTKTSILQASGGQTSLLTPKPFSVHIPSVQINEEFSTVGSTTPQTLVSAEIPQFTNIQQTVKQYSTPRGFTVSQPVAVSVTTPAPEVHTLGGFDKSSLSSFSGIPRTETHRFGQTNLRQNEFSNKISAVTARVPVVTQSFGYSSGVSGAGETSVVTPKPDVHTFEYTASGHGVDINQPFVSTETPLVGFKITDQSGRTGLGKSVASVGIPAVQTFSNNVDINQPFVSTETPLVGFKITDQSGRTGLGKSVASVDIPAVQTFSNNEEQHLVNIGQSGVPLVAVTPSVTTGTGFFQSSIDDKVSNELKFNKPQNTFSVPVGFSKTGSEQFNLVSNKISQGTPRPDFHILSQSGLSSNVEAGKSQVTVSYNLPSVTPQPDINLSGYNREHVTQTVSFVSPEVTSGVKNNFHQTGSAGVLKDFSKAFSVPASVPQSNGFEFSSSLQQEEGKKSYGIPLVTPQIKTDVQTQQISHGFFKPVDVKFAQIGEPVQPGFGQRYSYSSSFKQSGNRFGSIQPFGSVSSTPKPAFIEKTQVVPKIEELKVTVEPQPVVSVGTVSSAVADQTLSTPAPYSTFQSSGINLKSTFVQPQVFTVTTPAPVASVTPSVGLSGVNIIESGQTIALKEQEKINVGSYSPAVVSFPQKINLDQTSHFKVETKSFSPVAHVTTAVPTNIGKSFYDKTNAFLPPTQHISAVQYGNDGTNQVLVQEEQSKPGVELLKTKFEEKITEFAPHQPQVRIGTAAPAYQPSLPQTFVTSKPFTPREQLVGLEITKSIEVNPDEFFQKTEEQVPVKPIQIQQQPLEFISQKRFPVKQPTFYQHQEIVNIQNKNVDYNQQEVPKTEILEQKQYLLPAVTSKPVINSYSTVKTAEQPVVYSGGVAPVFEASKIPLTIHKNLDYHQQEVPKTEILEQKQYLLPAVTTKPIINSYSTVKTAEQPVVYSGGVAPVFEASKIPLTIKTDTKQYLSPSGFVKNPAKTVFVEQYEKQQPVVSRLNILQPTSTQSPQYTPSIGEELTVQTHRNFDSKKINTFGTTPLQSVFVQPEIQSTLRPAVDIFQPSGFFKHNLTSGSGFKYAVNPNIEIPEPPAEYILAQNGYTTVAPELSTAGRSQFQSTTESFNRFGSSISYAKPTEAFNSFGSSASYAKPTEAFNSFGSSVSFAKPTEAFNSFGSSASYAKPTEAFNSFGSSASYAKPTEAFNSFGSSASYAKSTEAFNSFGSSGSYAKPTEAFNSFGSSTSYAKPTEGNLNEEEIPDGNIQQILEKYSGRFGQVIGGNNGNGQGEGSSTVRYEVSSTTSRPRTRGRLYHGDITSGRQATNKYEEYEINGERSLETEKEGNSKTTIDLKNLKVDKNKKTVIVVSQVSDANPVLIGKLAGQCSCQSNMLELRTKGKKSKAGVRRKNKNSSTPQHSIISNEYLPPFEGSQSKIEVETLTSGGASTAQPETVVIGGSKSSYSEQNLISSSTTAAPELVSSTILSSLGPDGVLSITPKTLFVEEKVRSKSKQFRGRTRYLPPSSLLSEDGSSVPLLSPVPASEIASTFDYSILKGDESRSQNEIDGGRGAGAGAAFDRYGPGGWRSFDETLQGSIDCKRPGLFRHPKHCNKFYACNYDPWKEQFTLHVFNCPIHLTYDSSISACNWPVRGPACADDNLLV